MEERLLLDSIALAEHDVIAISPIHVQINLPDVVRVETRAKAHSLVNAVLLLGEGGGKRGGNERGG